MLKLTGVTNRLIIGIGNPLRGDDAFGPEVIRYLQDNHPDLASYRTERSDLTRIIDHWVDKDVLIIDAVQTANGDLGAIHFFSDFTQLSSQSLRKYSSHRMSIADVYALGKRLGLQPRSMRFIGVEGANWRLGDAISDQLKKQIPEVADTVLRYFSEVAEPEG